MSKIIGPNPLGTYIKNYLTPTKDAVTEWLNTQGKTFEDIIWWQIDRENVLSDHLKISLYVRFVDDETTYRQVFSMPLKGEV